MLKIRGNAVITALGLAVLSLVRKRLLVTSLLGLVWHRCLSPPLYLPLTMEGFKNFLICASGGTFFKFVFPFGLYFVIILILLHNVAIPVSTAIYFWNPHCVPDIELTPGVKSVKKGR